MIASCKAVITADQGMRGGKVIELKKTVDEAVTNCDFVKNVFVMTRTGAPVSWQHGRDVKLEEVSTIICLHIYQFIYMLLLLLLLLLGNGEAVH